MAESAKIPLCTHAQVQEAGVLKVARPQHSNISMILIHKDGVCFAYRNVCPHFSIQLDNAKGRFLPIKTVILCVPTIRRCLKWRRVCVWIGRVKPIFCRRKMWRWKMGRCFGCSKN